MDPENVLGGPNPQIQRIAPGEPARGMPAAIREAVPSEKLRDESATCRDLFLENENLDPPILTPTVP